MSAWGSPRTSEIKKSRDLEILRLNKMQKRMRLKLWTEMNHEPSQFSGPPTREGATLDVPLPESATLSDMCVNGPIVYEWLDSVQRSQVHLLQWSAPNRAPSSPPDGRGQESGWRIACAREWMDELCVLGCVRDWEYASLGWNACRDGGGKKREYNIWREAKFRNATMMLAKVSGKKCCLWKRGWSSNPWKEELRTWEKKCH